MRLIDADALLAKAQELGWGGCGQLCDLIRNAPTLQPAEGDAISQDYLITKLCMGGVFVQHGGNIQQEEILRLVREAPSLPVSAPDVVTAEDVVEGVEAHDAEGYGFVVGDVESGIAKVLDGTLFVHLPLGMVAAMLNAAESITWPEGHPRNPKPKEPRVWEFENERTQTDCMLVIVSMDLPVNQKVRVRVEEVLDDAIEAERKGEGSND